MDNSKLLGKPNKLWGSDLRWTSIPSRGSRNTPSQFMPRKPGKVRRHEPVLASRLHFIQISGPMPHWYNTLTHPIIADTLDCKAHAENKLVIPVFQTGCKETQEFEDHVQHTWSAVPPAACSSSVLNLRRMPH